MNSYLIVKQFARTLRNLDAVLEKATKYAEARKFDVNNFVTARLFPDMLPFVSQIRIACDHAKGGRREPVGQGGPQARGHRDDDAGAARPASPSASRTSTRSRPRTSSASSPTP